MKTKPTTRWCPRCAAEYRPGFTTCADCGVKLVAEEPAKTGTPAPPRRPVLRQHCPRCGVRLPQVPLGEWFETGERCAECGVTAMVDAPVLPPSRHDLAYRVEELSLNERVAITADLIERRIPFRWEDDLVLVVPDRAENHVDRLIDDVSETTPAYGEGSE